MYNLNYKFFLIFLNISINLLININCLFENKWISSSINKASSKISTSDTKITITTFENQTIYLPCAMQSMNFQQSVIQDQLTLILWYRSWNVGGGSIGPPIYSIDFRNLDRINSIKNKQQNAIHFISNGELRNRILFEFNTCWLSETYQIYFYKSLNKTINQSINYQNLNRYFYYQFNNSKLINQHLNNSDHLLKKNNFINHFEPICAFLKLDQVKKSDTGRFSCRVDFRRSRTLFSQFLIKVLEQPKIFQIQINDRIFANNSIISELNEGSSLIVHCSTHILDKNDVYLHWECDNQLNNFYTNEDEKNMESDFLVNKLNIKHLYRIFNEKSCSCYLISNSGQRLMYLKFYFQLYLAPLKVSLIEKDDNINESQNAIFKKRILRLDADQLSAVKCIAKGSRPLAATCKWSLLNGFQFKSKDYSESTLIESVSNDSSQLTVATISTLHLLATNQMHNQVIRCVCSNPLLPTIQMADQIQLEIQSKPILHLVSNELNKNITKLNKELLQYDNLHQTYKHQIRDGDLVKLICNILKSNPPLIGDIKWFINDLELEKFKKLHPNATVEKANSESTSKLIIQKVNRETIGHYFCMAKNEKGEAKSNLIILDVQYAPFCRPQQKNLYTLTLGETIEIDCDLYGMDILHDVQIQFYWTLNKQQLPNSMFTLEPLSNISINDQIRWSNFEINENYIHNNLIRNKLKFNSSNYQFKHAKLSCWATNSFGTQIEPCLFNLLVIGRPEKPKNCSIQYYEDNHLDECQIEIGCEPGNNNGLQQKLHLNIYEITGGGLTTFHNSTASFNNLNFKKTNDEFNNSKLIMSDHVLNHPTIIQHKATNFIGQFNKTNFLKLSNCCLDKNQVVSDLIVNQTISIKINQYTRFRRFNLSTIKHYLFIIYASNSKGLSELVEFEWMFDTGTTMTPSLLLNHFQYFILIGYFLVGIFLCILLTYLLKLQLLIFNYRLLSSKNNQKIIQSTNQPFLIENNQINLNNLSNNNRLSKSCNSIYRKSNNLYENKYLFKTIDRSNLTKFSLHKFKQSKLMNEPKLDQLKLSVSKINVSKLNVSKLNQSSLINNNLSSNINYSDNTNHLSSHLIANYQTQSNLPNKSNEFNS